MCGFSGIIDFFAPPPKKSVENMTAALRHRGPDMGGTACFTNCVLGHRRLSILDLSESAKQPMLSQDGKIALVFNGEIYNFKEIRRQLEKKGKRFKTQSDTEVILELYLEKQESLLSELNGMFSIAIWDDSRQRLFVARDRVGKKPLYYFRRRGRFSFSSELFSLIQDPQVPRRLSEQALIEYLLYDFIPGPHSIFEQVYKLPPAHYAIFDMDGLRIRRYWMPPWPEKETDYLRERDRLEHLLFDSVEKRLIADVPLGAFLSGGIDSTLVTALMRAKDRKVKTFSISFPGTTHDESKWAALAARSLGTDHNEYAVEYNIKKIFPRIVKHFGEPFGDSSAVPTWHLCEQTRQNVTVALSGDGGDELFGGYERYIARRFQLLYDEIPLRLREQIIEPLIDRLPATTDYYGTSLSKKLKLFVQAARRIRENPFAVIPRTFSRNEIRDLTGIDYCSGLDPVLLIAKEFIEEDPVDRMLWTDIQTYMAEDILTKVDRMSMAHSLEVRSPLLDYRIAELACRLPIHFKIKRFKTKLILKDIAKAHIPMAIINRSKYGFQIPLGRWFKGQLKPWAAERLFDTGHNFFRREKIEGLWKDHQDGRADNAHKLWLLIVFNEWYTQFC